MTPPNVQIDLYLHSAKSVIKFLLRTGFSAVYSSRVQSGATIEQGFFGINVATSADARVDDFVIQRLQELGLRQVRMGFSYDSWSGDAERLLSRLLEADFEVLLVLVPPLDEAKNFDAEAKQRWGDFVRTVAERYANKLVMLEIGSTPNRGTWSGIDAVTYLSAWEIARQQLLAFDIVLLAPNVSDFEPFFSLHLLSEMERKGVQPDRQSNNLFVERAVQPEAFDDGVMGRWMAGLLRMNLVKKARVMRAIGQFCGVDRLICTYTCWTSKRLWRWSSSPERKKADYLVRYLILAAASGALEKVYWGPLICSRDGLIGDGTSDYPAIDNVTFYQLVRGDFENFVIREAFYAYANVIRLLSGARCTQAINADNGIHHFIFETQDNKQLHIAWTMDRGSVPLRTLYDDEQLRACKFFDIDGTQFVDPVLSIGERPIFMLFEQALPAKISAAQVIRLDPRPAERVVGITPGVQYQAWEGDGWRGLVAIQPGEDAAAKVQALLPEQLLKAEQLCVHRDQRNRVWSIRHPLDGEQTLVVKENRAKGIKRFSYRFKASKGQRHWDNASEMLRRGVNTPAPVAYFERIKNSGTTHNYYVCAYVDVLFSARDAFTAFSRQANEYQGLAKADILRAVAEYSRHMHKRHFIHHDLSGGNLLVTLEAGRINISVIDIGRATIVTGRPLSERERLLDLMRICYKLNWADRETFMEYYFQAHGKPFSGRWRTSLRYYDWKHKWKKNTKRSLKRKLGLKK